MNKNILVIDDDMTYGNIITLSLKACGFNVFFVSLIVSIEEIIREFKPSLILFDIEIANKNGIEKAGELNKLFPSLPIIINSSHVDETYTIKALENGCVAVLDKAVDLNVLISYVNRFATKYEEIINFSNFTLNIKTHELTTINSNIVIKLSCIENYLLYILLSNINENISREEIIEKISTEDTINLTILANTINKLREYIASDESLTIKTIKGVGYSLQTV